VISASKLIENQQPKWYNEHKKSLLLLTGGGLLVSGQPSLLSFGIYKD
jgi:hypothetical protein